MKLNEWFIVEIFLVSLVGLIENDVINEKWCYKMLIFFGFRIDFLFFLGVDLEIVFCSKIRFFGIWWS